MGTETDAPGCIRETISPTAVRTHFSYQADFRGLLASAFPGRRPASAHNGLGRGAPGNWLRTLELLPYAEFTLRGCADQVPIRLFLLRLEFLALCFFPLICRRCRNRDIRPVNRGGIINIPMRLRLRAPPLRMIHHYFLPPTRAREGSSARRRFP